jgi:hypothetical protein
MRTSLNEIKLIEDYLTDQLDVQARLMVEGRIIADNSFRTNVNLQRIVYSLLEAYSLRRIKEEAKEIHMRLVNSPDKDFNKGVQQIFQKR